jgi:undecaprenyl-diphosphatase
MPIWHAVLLGVVQGLTEFLPISSTAHLLLAQQLLGRSWRDLKDDPFTVVIQLGTTAAVFAYFRADVLALSKGFARDVAGGHLVTSASPEGRLVKLIVLGTVPAVLAGLFLKTWLRDTFYGAVPIAVVAIVFALLMWLAEWWAARRSKRPEASIGWADAVWVGVWQALALMPGGSRSGTTITAGLFAGLTRPAAARFSFLLSLPIVLAAGVKDFYDWWKAVSASSELRATVNDQLLALAVGTLVSFVVGYWSIAFLMKFLQRRSLLVFVAYRLALGLLILALVAAGVVER